MPPPMPNPSKRMTAQPSRPVARYRPGKPAAEEESSDEDESEEEQQQQPQKRHATRPQQPRPTVQAEAEDDDDDEEGFVTDPEDDVDGGAPLPPSKPSQPSQSNLPISRPPPASKPQIPTHGDENDEASDSSAETSESDSDASSSSEEPQRKFQRPTFIRKADRTTATQIISTHDTTDDQAQETYTRRLAETESLIAERIQRDALARAAGRKAWDDDDAVLESMVDDTDGLDPEAEHAAWRLRELMRLKRDREAMIEREKEIEELERRRNLTAAEREAEDAEHISKQRKEKDARGQSGYLARYHHKGAFFQDDEVAEVLKKRDVMGAKFVDEVDKSVLPEYMRIRDMNKLGKKGRTRYKDLKNEDTGRWGDEVKRWRPGDRRREGDGMDRGVDERFLPDDDRRGPTASGANASALGERRRRRSFSRERIRSYSRSRSRSRSPQRRKRSPSYDRRADDEDRGKRRRVVDAV
jgi:microfibrillar-associated protein 1